MNIDQARTATILARHAKGQRNFTEAEFVALTWTIVEALEIRLDRIEKKLGRVRRERL